MSTYVAASPVPLFDRLFGSAPESTDGRLLDADGLEASIRRDFSRLLNVRSGLAVDDFLQTDGTVLDYGLPDLVSLSSQSDTDLQRLATVVTRAIELFEPRLSRVQVRARPDEAFPQAARLTISAAVGVGHQLRRVEFDLPASESGF